MGTAEDDQAEGAFVQYLLYRGVSECRKGSVGKVTKEVRATVLSLHGRGRTIAEIARETKTNRKQVARILAHEGIKNAPSTPATSRLPEILELSSQGVSVTELGRRLGFSRKAVAKALTGHDVR